MFGGWPAKCWLEVVSSGTAGSQTQVMGVSGKTFAESETLQSMQRDCEIRSVRFDAVAAIGSWYKGPADRHGAHVGHWQEAAVMQEADHGVHGRLRALRWFGALSDASVSATAISLWSSFRRVRKLCSQRSNLAQPS